ncbi:hypothetical protein [Ornithinibacillus contaminans]|uniref:hypothetical protein n=1 Tax=Ornithinibacillus contaminans TaxID=694055 RepID=UPI00064E13F3|nr:hypothetical protein [Ornithinibacillus contaminans]
MKKISSFIHKESGFILPAVMLLSTLVFLYVATNIISYSHDRNMTENNLEQLKAQTLFQMGYAQLQKQLMVEEDLTQQTYTFPQGTTKITLQLIDVDRLQLFFEITTDTNYQFSMTKTVTIPITTHSLHTLE